MTKPKEVYRATVALSGSDEVLLDELAKGIGCSRASIMAYLLSGGLGMIAKLPARRRNSVMRECKRLFEFPEMVSAADAVGKNINNITVIEAKKILRARGVSRQYIETVLDGMVEEVRHASAR